MGVTSFQAWNSDGKSIREIRSAREVSSAKATVAVQTMAQMMRVKIGVVFVGPAIFRREAETNQLPVKISAVLRNIRIEIPAKSAIERREMG